MLSVISLTLLNVESAAKIIISPLLLFHHSFMVIHLFFHAKFVSPFIPLYVNKKLLLTSKNT